MQVQEPDGTPQSDVPLPLVVPTEAEVRAADLEHDDTTARQEQAQDREARIRKAAYAKAEQRRFEPGHEVEDWLEAERNVDEETVDELGLGTSSPLRPGPR